MKLSHLILSLTLLANHAQSTPVVIGNDRAPPLKPGPGENHNLPSHDNETALVIESLSRRDQNPQPLKTRQAGRAWAGFFRKLRGGSDSDSPSPPPTRPGGPPTRPGAPGSSRQRPDSATAPGSAAARQPGEAPEYTGTPPRGMNEGEELEMFKRFVKEEPFANDAPPAPHGDYFFYSGEGMAENRDKWALQYNAENNVKMNSWMDTYDGTAARAVFSNIRPQSQGHIFESNALSGFHSRRKALRGGDLHLVLKDKNEPLLGSRSHWANVEAGIVTHPDSHVQRIIRHNWEDIDNGKPAATGEVVWEKDKHQPLGRSMEEQDWSISARDIDDNPVYHATPLRPDSSGSSGGDSYSVPDDSDYSG